MLNFEQALIEKSKAAFERWDGYSALTIHLGHGHSVEVYPVDDEEHGLEIRSTLHKEPQLICGSVESRKIFVMHAIQHFTEQVNDLRRRHDA